ncbi:hypothetical protein F53441_12564 [Fusarium austroafricanum]|uniref:Uncharacterized protein n=1 Tax=Fusarium austroafricanum TaxID=2364996 RepID=A0A8H4NVC6_9HYPO|nr:hypothetical protein F53441_12564 [Fusarium austroafricanum]
MYLDSKFGALASRAEKLDLSRILPREAKASETCTKSENLNTCDKPGMNTGEVLVILLVAGYISFYPSPNLLANLDLSAIILAGIMAFVYRLHRKNQRKEAEEDLKHQELDDYGIAPVKKQKSDAQMPRAPPPTYERPEDKDKDKKTTEGNWNRRDSTDSLTPSLRQAMGVTPRDTLANS